MIAKYLSGIGAAFMPARRNDPRHLRLFALMAGLVVFGLLSVAPILAQSPPTANEPIPSFDAASIKPNHSGDARVTITLQSGKFTATGTTIKQVIGIAYNVKDFQISRLPGWASSDRYDIEAKVPDLVAAELDKLPPDERKEKFGPMLQPLLAERLKLKVSHETKELSIYALVVAKNGPKLQETKLGDTSPNSINDPDVRRPGPGTLQAGKGRLSGREIPMTTLAMALSQQVGRTVVDQTGLKGKYDIALQWTADDGQAPGFRGSASRVSLSDNGRSAELSGPSLLTAIQEELGLKLDSKRGPVDVLVIDHIEPPAEK